MDSAEHNKPLNDYFPSLLDRIDIIGGHHLTMMTLLAYASEPDIFMNAVRLRRTLTNMQGEHVAWLPNRTTTSQAQDKLDRTGLVDVKGSTEDTCLPKRRINELGLVQGLPLCGILLGWQLDYPEESHSLTKVLGLNNTKNPREHGVPSLRLGLYHLLTASDEPVLTVEREEALDVTGVYIHNEDRLLQQRGILDITEIDMGRGRIMNAVSLTPTFKQPIHELVSRMSILQDMSTENIESAWVEARERAEKIIDSLTQVSTLMTLGSARAKKQ